MRDLSVRNLRDVGRGDVQTVGGKAASLGELLQAGIAVPPGFVVTTMAFGRDMTPDLQQDVLAAFDELGFDRVAVRSSAVAEDSGAASWAGQLETYLNIGREGLIEAIQKCQRSIQSEHAQAYATEHRIGSDQQAVAVVVQGMVVSDISGVLFTANPITGRRDEYMLEAAYGLGELLVQGEITPESIVMTSDGQVIDRAPSRQRSKLVYKDGANRTVAIDEPGEIVSDQLLVQLAQAGRAIEAHYGTPQDVEWAVQDGKLYIVQARPITTI